MAVVDKRSIVRDLEFPFKLERSDGDGRTFEGLAAVFNSPTPISDQRGEYIETVAPGAFTKSIKDRTPVLMYNHGRSAPIGDIPIGKITEIREVPEGLFVRARLVDNPTINIVRDAIRDEAITGMSFRSKIIRDAWSSRGSQKYCTLKELSVIEVGPVATPAYRDTTATVRSMLDELGQTYPELVRVEWLGRDDDVEVTTWDQSPADVLSDMIAEMWGLGEQNANVYVIDMFNDHAIFTVQPAGHTKYPGLWQANFSKNADGSLSVQDPSRPPLADYDLTALPRTPTSDEPQPAHSGAPAVDGPQGAVNKVASADEADVERAMISAADMNNLPDSAFAYIEPGGTKDSGGKTVPRSKRHFPIHDAAHVRNALARAPQSPFGKQALPAITAAAKKFGIGDYKAASADDTDFSTSEDAAMSTSEDAAVRATTPKTKEQVMKQIALRRRGIRV